jgi:glycosyltransferase involved in cell wall biosynthesis
VALELLSYLRTELGWQCPIVVVDQSSDGGRQLAQLLESNPLPDIRHFRDHRRGTGAARNQGARLAETPWLLFLDDDVRPAREYWDALAEFVERNVWVDAVQGATEQRDAWQEYCRGDDRGSRDAACPMVRRRYPEHWSGVEWLTTIPWANYGALTIGTGSGNLAITRAAFFGAGGFDEQIEGLGDDREFGLRLWWYGYRAASCPGAVAFHLREPSGGIRSDGRSRMERLFAPEPSPGAVYLYLKWFPGQPFREMVLRRLLNACRRPWTLPVKAIRLQRSVAIARRRVAAGPIHVSSPVARPDASDAFRVGQAVLGAQR